MPRLVMHEYRIVPVLTPEGERFSITISSRGLAERLLPIRFPSMNEAAAALSDLKKRDVEASGWRMFASDGDSGARAGSPCKDMMSSHLLGADRTPQQMPRPERNTGPSRTKIRSDSTWMSGYSAARRSIYCQWAATQRPDSSPAWTLEQHPEHPGTDQGWMFRGQSTSDSSHCTESLVTSTNAFLASARVPSL